jgi:hypothetical protein
MKVLIGRHHGRNNIPRLTATGAVAARSRKNLTDVCGRRGMVVSIYSGQSPQRISIIWVVDLIDHVNISGYPRFIDLGKSASSIASAGRATDSADKPAKIE